MCEHKCWHFFMKSGEPEWPRNSAQHLWNICLLRLSFLHMARPCTAARFENTSAMCEKKQWKTNKQTDIIFFLKYKLIKQDIKSQSDLLIFILIKQLQTVLSQ